MWISERPDRVIVRCQIQPRASKTEIVGLHGEPARLKIRIAAPPVDGEANAELIGFLAKRLGVAKSAVEVVAGHTGKMKDVSVRGISLAEVQVGLGFV